MHHWVFTQDEGCVLRSSISHSVSLSKTLWESLSLLNASIIGGSSARGLNSLSGN